MTFEQQVALLPERYRDAVLERAGILEYEAGMPRAEAEKLALELWRLGMGRA